MTVVIRSKLCFRIGRSVVNSLVVRVPLLVGCKRGSGCTKAKQRNVGGAREVETRLTMAKRRYDASFIDDWQPGEMQTR
jgi:hypothetical protein